MTPCTLVGAGISKRSCCRHHAQVEVQGAFAKSSKFYVAAVTEL
jgi:hypothetical protein